MVHKREINIGKSKIKFKNHTKNFSCKGTLLQLIIQTYKIKGRKNISKDFEEKLTQYIEKIEDEVLVFSNLRICTRLDSERIKNIHPSREMWLQ